MPAVSERQRRAMWAAAEGHSKLGIPESVGREFVRADRGVAPGGGELSDYETAEAIRDRELPSPTRYGDFWLFALRITGTGAAYRDALGEFAIRDPHLWLTEQFVQRCAGLPVIFEHPARAGLDSHEFAQRAIGTIVLPYREGDEVWGIAKIFDADAAALMQTSHRSTSPGVVPQRDVQPTQLRDGTSVLDETLPLVLDHLAICEIGVWDKDGPPLGVRLDHQTVKDSIMPTKSDEDDLRKQLDDAVLRADAAEAALRDLKGKHDSEEEHERDDRSEDRKGVRDVEGNAPAGEIDDKRIAEMSDEEFAEYERGDMKLRRDALRARRDALRPRRDEDGREEVERAESEAEKYGKDEHEAEERAAKAARDEKKDSRRDRRDGAKVEAVDADQIEELKDARRHDARSLRELQRQVDALTRPQSHDDRNAISQAFHRADALMQKLGEVAPMALPGESPIAYRRRLANCLRKYSPPFKDYALHDSAGAAFDHIEDVIYRDAEAASREQIISPDVGLREVVTTKHGKTRVEFIGDARTAWLPFAPPMQQIISKFTNAPGDTGRK